MNKQSNVPTIMIVDDTPANLDVLETILVSNGCKVVAFPRGDLALRAGASNPPDLIFLDIMMPVLDGFEVCRQFKANETLREIPIIFISALDDIESKLKAFSQGGVDYVSKPFQEQEVLARMNTHLKLRSTQIELEKYSHHLEELVDEKIHEILSSQMATLTAISRLSEIRDDTTGKHIERTRTLCMLLARKLQQHPNYAKTITDDFVNNLFFAAPLHDIGKVGIPDKILLKPGKLTDEEFEIMKSHVTLGYMSLLRVLEMYPQNEFIHMGVDLTMFHHEKWNGDGYPNRAAGSTIPVSARIMALVDVYDALRSKRPYKDGFPHSQAVASIRDSSGKQFDPDIVEAFLAIESAFAQTYDELCD